MKLLFIGDIFGRPGREAVAKYLPDLISEYSPDFIIANGENLASGKGITPKIYHQMQGLGIDLLTGGNHSFKRSDILTIIDDQNTQIIRPANVSSMPGRGYALLKKGDRELLIINLLGQVFIEEVSDSPFTVADKILNKINSKFTLIDFHGEATSEKRALAEYLDGRVSAVVGTHTHVQTSDEQILPKGTSFITDVGMTGPTDSILGVKKELILERFLTQNKEVFDVAEGPAHLCAVYLKLGDDGKTEKIERVLRH